MKRNATFKVLLMFIVGLFLSVNTFAQQIVVKGIVKDTTGEPIIGANVIVKGTTNGTITDFDGNFLLNANKGDIIIISFIGYRSQEAQAAASMNIILKDDKYMLKISLYHNYCLTLCKHIETPFYGNNQSYTIDRPATLAIRGWLSQWQKPCISYALPRNPAEITGFEIDRSRSTDRNDAHLRQFVGQALREGRRQRLGNQTRTWTQTDNGLLRRRISTPSHRTGPTECEESQGSVAAGLRQGSERKYFQGFFIRIGARYRRIRKRPKGKPSPQLYAYKSEKLQELEIQANDGLIDLYFGDESHICTEGYVPYGWQFRGEDVYIPSQRGYRLNIFGMIDRNNRYEGFTTDESITAEKVADFLDRLSMIITKDTFVVLDNASIHRGRIFAELRPVWEKRGLFLFFLPPYSPHLNIAETLWRILKGKWIRPADYVSTDSLLYATNRALAALGSELHINFVHAA